MGISMTDKGVESYFCKPYAYPHVVIDPKYSFNHPKEIMGYWKLINRDLIMYVDSISLSDKSIYQSDSLLKRDTNDVLLEINQKKAKLYVNESGKSFKNVMSKSYELLDGRFFLIYPSIFKTCPTTATNFVGKTNEGYLIFDNYNFVRKTKPSSFIVFESTVTRMVFEKLGEIEH